jgi:hypothetical protein
MAPSANDEGFTSNEAGEVFNSLGWQIQNARGYRINEEPYDSRRKIRVIHIGAGASGITFAKFAEDRCQSVEVQIYEKVSVSLARGVPSSWWLGRIVILAGLG